MDFEQYQQTFLHILNDAEPVAPYNSPDYINYVQLNWSRQQRWLKLGILNADLLMAIQSISSAQFWTVITEPWCGDASHTLPFIHRLAKANPLIHVDYQLRDSEPFLINKYLTNGKKSIPKLIIADKENKVFAVWGPRPAECQRLFEQMRKDNVDLHEGKIALQKWYNEDKGQSFQQELLQIVQKMITA